MGRLCTFNDANLSPESLLETWNMCLGNLARYDGLSSIAKKSCYVLNQSARRLIPGHAIHVQGRGEPSNPQMETGLTQEDSVQGIKQSTEEVNLTSMLNAAGNPGAAMVETLARQSDSNGPPFDSSLALAEPLPFLDPDLGFDRWPGIDDEFSGGDFGTLNWPFLPFLSQLEAMSSPFDF